MMKTKKNKKRKMKTSKNKMMKTKRIIIKNNNLNTKRKHDYKNFNFKKLRCSPKEKNKMNSFSCYTNESLYKLRDLWNNKHSNKIIKTNDPKEIHLTLTSYMSSICDKESCWLNQEKDFGKIDKELFDSFAPESPVQWKKNPNEWLSSIDIDKVMKQYEKAYKCFEFIGPSPIDFDTKLLFGECVWDELCKFSIKNQIKREKFKIGIIFNTDTHDKSGEHWISMFINIKKGEIFYFDSVGNTAPKQIKVFVDRITQQGKELNINFKYDENHPVEHQYGNTECGIYSIFFIVHMLQDKITEQYLKTHVLKDKFMSEFRDKYFNKTTV